MCEAIEIPYYEAVILTDIIHCYPLPNLNRKNDRCLLLNGAGVLPEWGQVPPGRIQRAVGLHAGRDKHHPPGTVHPLLTFCNQAVSQGVAPPPSSTRGEAKHPVCRHHLLRIIDPLLRRKLCLYTLIATL
jgi:hypothetical protein